ncbi:hypothetical protein J5N97_010735 [Dioscorea zingiberensis]|uniref:C2H2-type domain-containing protein n=1 Tax=Dioscorea zingiberensis TaxID=325984 RepID=A0A9D5D1R5_9LILI|nr:hypothetical protein J5N97_010735 [Dioscorea zingiberensis]
MRSGGKEKISKLDYSAPPPGTFLKIKIKIKDLRKNEISSQKPGEKDSKQDANHETTLHVCTVCCKDHMMGYTGLMNFDPDSMGHCENRAALILQMLSEDVTDNSISRATARALVTKMHDFYLEAHKRKKTENDDDDVQKQVQEEKTKAYECFTCNKLFSTPQALGGHRASHTKVKNSSDVGETLEKGKMISGQTEKHQCNQCEAGFPCGQALGGHMRKHFLKDHPWAMTVEQSHQVFDFDLNEEPIMEGEVAGEKG